MLAKGSQPIRAEAVRWRVVADRLLVAADFVEVAIAVCEVSRDQFLIEECEVTLNTQDGRRGVCVDNFADVTDEDRLARISEMRGTDPSVLMLREHHAPITHADHEHTLLLPLLQMGGLVGTIRYRQALTPDQLRDLKTLATYASVRLVQFGTTTDLADRLRLLTPREREVARYVSYGRTNAEVGLMLGMSENTVKKHLKEVFAVFDTTNRTELAALFRDLPPDADSVPLGVTRVRDVAIARRH